MDNRRTASWMTRKHQASTAYCWQVQRALSKGTRITKSLLIEQIGL